MKTNHYLLVKRIYVCILAIYVILRDVIPLYRVVSSGVYSASIFAFGLLLVAVDLFTKKDCLQARFCDFLLVFLAVCVISTCVNYKYGLVSNLKAIGWMLLYYCLLYPNDAEKDSRTLPALFHTVTITMTALLLISITMYFFDVGYTYFKPEGTFTDQGFSFMYSRLWGVFHEANYAAVYMEIALFMSVSLAFRSEKWYAIILRVLQCILFASFIVLSGSRTAVLVLILASAWIGFYRGFHIATGKALSKTVVSAISAILVAAIVYGILQTVSFCLPYVKRELNDLTGEQTAIKVRALYDDFYDWGQVNIVERSSERFNTEDVVIDGTVHETEPTYVETTSPLDSSLTEPSQNNQTEIDATQPTESTNNDDNGKTDIKIENEVEKLGRTDLEDSDISNGRFKRWKEGFEIFCVSPIIGASPRGVTLFAKEYCPDTNVAKYSYSISNSVLDLMASTGIVGSAIMLVFLLLSAVFIIKDMLTHSYDCRKMVLSGMIVVGIASAMLESDLFFLLTTNGVVFWFVLGILNGDSQESVSYRIFNRVFKWKER